MYLPYIGGLNTSIVSCFLFIFLLVPCHIMLGYIVFFFVFRYGGETFLILAVAIVEFMFTQ